MKAGRVLWILLLAIVLAAGCCAVTVAGLLITRGITWGSDWAAAGRVQATAAFDRTLAVQPPTLLNLDVPLGDVIIQTGATDQVIVKASLRAWGRTQADAQAQLDQLAIQVTQDGQHVRVETPTISSLNQQSGATRSPEIELHITVPPQTTLKATTEVGRLDVTGLRGDVSITAGVGAVSLADVLPKNRLEVWSRVGNIELRGPLAAGATYDLASDVGWIALRVPANSAFTIEAHSDLGDVALGFPLVGSSQRELVSKELRGEVGSDPSATLTLRSRVGAVSVQPLP